MEIINNNKDVLHVIFSKLSSYKRSKICTVCSTWYRVLLDTMSLIENESAVAWHMAADNYHTLVRMGGIPIDDFPVVDTLLSYRSYQSNRLYMLMLEEYNEWNSLSDTGRVAEFSHVCAEAFGEYLENELDSSNYDPNNKVVLSLYKQIQSTSDMYDVIKETRRAYNDLMNHGDKGDWRDICINSPYGVDYCYIIGEAWREGNRKLVKYLIG